MTFHTNMTNGPSDRPRTPTTREVKRVYVLAPDNLARDGRKDWSMEADAQFDRWLAAHDAELRKAVVEEVVAEAYKHAQAITDEDPNAAYLIRVGGAAVANHITLHFGDYSE